MIDWRKIAEQNGLTPEEFRKEIFNVAAQDCRRITFCTAESVARPLLLVVMRYITYIVRK